MEVEARMAASTALGVSGGGVGFCAVYSAQAMVMLMAKSAARRRNQVRNCDIRIPPGRAMLRTRCLFSANVSRNHVVFLYRGFLLWFWTRDFEGLRTYSNVLR